jgi:hypothetical protein
MRKWTAKEIADLRAFWAEGFPAPIIAVRLHRSIAAVKRKARELKLEAQTRAAERRAVN